MAHQYIYTTGPIKWVVEGVGTGMRTIDDASMWRDDTTENEDGGGDTVEFLVDNSGNILLQVSSY